MKLKLWPCIPEEAAVVDDTCGVCAGGAVANMSGGGGQAGGTVGGREIASTLKESEHRDGSCGLLGCGKVVIIKVSGKFSKRCV